jgi:hypothetical protein
VNKPHLIALRVKRTSAHTSARWHSYDDIGILPPTIVYLGKIINNLRKTRACKIGKLHFHNAFNTFDAQPKRSSDDAAFTQGRIAYPVFAE